MIDAPAPSKESPVSNGNAENGKNVRNPIDNRSIQTPADVKNNDKSSALVTGVVTAGGRIVIRPPAQAEPAELVPA
jgi:hypothetical protein